MKKNILTYLLVAVTVIGLLSMTSCKRNSPDDPEMKGPAGFYINLSGTANPSTIYISSTGAEAWTDIIVRALNNDGSPAAGYDIIFQESGYGFFEGFRVSATRRTDAAGMAQMRYYIPSTANIKATIMTNITVTLVNNGRLDGFLSEVNDVIPVQIVPYLTQGIIVHGHVLTPAGNGVPDITMVLDGDDGNMDSVTVTRDSGSYEFYLPPGWYGTISPDSSNYSFSPLNYEFTFATRIVSDIDGLDFIANFAAGQTLAADVTSWLVPREGGSQVVNITNSTGDSAISYTVVPSTDWIHVSTGSGTTPGSFTITVDQNLTGQSRAGSVTVTATDIQDTTVTISINQESDEANSDARLAVDIPFVNAPGDGLLDFLVNAYNSTTEDSISFIITKSHDWFSVDPASQGTTDQVLNIDVEANTGAARTGTLTLTPVTTGVPNTVVITINQEAGASIALSTYDETIPASVGAGYSFTVFVTNPTSSDIISWVASNGDPWITAAPTTGTTGGGSFTITIQTDNPSSNVRQGVVTVTGANGSQAQLLITQEGS